MEHLWIENCTKLSIVDFVPFWPYGLWCRLSPPSSLTFLHITTTLAITRSHRYHHTHRQIPHPSFLVTVIWNNSHLRDKRPSFAHLLTLLFVWAAFCNPGLNLRLIILLLVTLRVASWWTLFQVFLFFCCDAISAVLCCVCVLQAVVGLCVVVFLQNTISSILLWCWVAVHLGEPGVQLQFEIESARYLIGILTCHSESSYCHSYCHHQSSQRHRRCIASCPPHVSPSPCPASQRESPWSTNWSKPWSVPPSHSNAPL